MTRTWTMMAGALLVASACHSSRMSGTQGQTHWLTACDGDSDCGDLSCICSVCVAACANGACAVDGLQTACFAADDGPVRALCEGAEPTPLCLEPCDGRCADGQRCVDGACIAAQDPMPRAGAGGSGGAGGSSGAPSEPAPLMPLTIHIANVTDLPVYVQTADCSGNLAWFGMEQGGEALMLFGGCITDCATYDPDTGVPGCPAICLAPQYELLGPGDELIFAWDGGHFEPDPRGCHNRVAMAEGTPLDVQFCWLTSQPDEVVPGFPEANPDDLVCTTVRTTYGETAITGVVTVR
jgi:hypothetical protein